MAKTTKSLVKDARLSGDLLLRILVGLLFICIGVQGLLGNTSNGLFRALDNEVLEIILGILLLICGVLLVEHDSNSHCLGACNHHDRLRLWP